MTLDLLNQHAILPNEIQKSYENGVLQILPCLYLQKVKKDGELAGEYGGWPALPASIEWPKVNGELQAFLCWIDLEKVSALYEGISSKGRLLIFQGDGNATNSVVHLSPEQVEESDIRKLTEEALYHRSGNFFELKDGYAYKREGFTLIRGHSVKYTDEVNGKLEKAIDKLVPNGTIGQVGGFLGVENDNIRESATFDANGAGMLLRHRKFWNTPVKYLPEGEDIPDDWELGKLMKIDLSPITNRMRNARVFLEGYEDTVKERVKSTGKRWTSKYRNLIKKMIKLEQNYGEDSEGDPGLCNNWIGEFIEAQEWLYRDEQLVIKILDSLGYQGERAISRKELNELEETLDAFDSEDANFGLSSIAGNQTEEVEAWCKAAEKGDMEALEKISEYMRLQEENERKRTLASPGKPPHERMLAMLSGVDKEKSDTKVVAEMTRVYELLAKHALEIDMMSLQYLTRELWRIPHNISCERYRARGERLSKADAKELKKSVEWKAQFTEEELKVQHCDWLPWLSIFEASGWCWGDCGQRIYLSSKKDIKNGDFLNYQLMHDFS